MRLFVAPPPGSRVEPGPAPSISIVIAAYQAAAFVGEAVASALEQTRPPSEVVVCDDGSTDDIEGALAPWRDRIVLVQRPHGGEGAAKNAAARAASGDFVAILDSDDVYLPERLQALSELAVERPDLDILTTDAYIEANGRTLRRCYEGGWTFEVEDQRREILHRNFIFGHAAVRRERLLEAGGFDETMQTVADYDLWLRMILGGSRAGLVHEPLARYRLREAGLSSRRAHHMAGFVTALEHAARHPSLGEDERREVADRLAAGRRELRLLEARTALLERSSDARSRSLAIARDDTLRPATRLKSAFAAALPGVAGRLLERRDRDAWTAAAGLRIPRGE